MQPENEFRQFGKEIPYKTPEGFFESVPGKTLLAAKKRAQKQKIKRLTWISIGVAASLTAILYLALPIEVPVVLPASGPVSQEKKAIVEPKQPEMLTQSKEPAKIPKKRVDSLVVNVPIAQEADATEPMSAVLSDLSDDELRQIAVLYNTDTFLRESME